MPWLRLQLHLFVPLVHPKPLLGPWSVGGILAISSAAALCIFLVCLLLCHKINFVSSCGRAFPHMALCPKAVQQYQTVDQEEQRYVLLAEHLLVNGLLPWGSVAVGCLAGSYFHRVPSWLLAAAFLPIGRQTVVELALMQVNSLSELTLSQWKAMVLSKVDILDSISDGLSLATAFWLSPEAGATFVRSFEGSFLHGFVSVIGAGGLMALALAFATFSQMAIVSGNASLCESAGMGAAAKGLGDSKAVEQAALVGFLTRTFSEQLPQVLLQTSLLMAKGQGLLGQPVILCSVAISCATATARVFGFLRWMGKREFDLPEHAKCALWSLLLLPPFCAFLAMAVAASKCYYMEACESREWGLSTGCMPLDHPVPLLV